MHRQFSLQPFSRHYSHSTNPFLDFLEFKDGGDGVQISVSPPEVPRLEEVLKTYKDVRTRGMLHTLTFVTINEYLYLLRAISKELSVRKRYALYYLAAAVSDFFLPTQKMVSGFTFSFGKSYVVPKLHTVFFSSRSIRFSQPRGLFKLKWTRYQRY